MSTDSKDHRSRTQLLEEIEQLRWRLEEAEQTIEAIRHGDVDALVVAGAQGEQVFSITGAEHIYRVIVETMNEAAATVDPDGTILFCNRRFCDLMKAPIEDVIGRKATAFAARPQQLPLKTLLKEARAEAIQQRLTLRAADGTSVPVQIAAGPLQMDGSTSICLVASDLTELEASANSIRILREHQQAVEESEARFRAIFESSQDAIVITDNEGVYLQPNPAVEAVFGLPPDQIIGRQVSDFLREDIDFPALWRDFVATGCYQGELPLVGTDEQARFVEVYAVTNILPGRHLLVVRDITERKQAREALLELNEQLQAQTGDLEAQTEELRVANEELGAREEALRVANEALRGSEARYRELVQNANSAIIRWTKDGVITFFNEYAQAFFGYREDEALGRHVNFLLPEQDSSGTDMRALARDIVEHPEKYENHVNENICRDGRRVWMAWTNRPILDENGQVVEILAVGSDVTERKRIEEDLRRERTLLDSIMRTTDVMLVLLDPDFNFVWVNPAYAEACRMKPEEMVGKNHFALYPHAENEAIFRKVRDSGEGVFYKDKPFAFADQPERGVTYWDLSLTPAKDAAGNVTGLVFTLRETTKFKEAEEALRMSEGKFRTLHAMSPVGIVLNRLDNGQFLESNQALWDMTGYTEEEFRSLSYWDITPIEYKDAEARQLELLHTVGRYGPYEKEYIRKDGSRFPVLLSGVRLTDAGGTDLIYSVVQDITELKAREQALRESEERFHRLFDDDLTGDFVSTPEGEILLCNPAFARIFGFPSAQDAVSTNVTDLYVNAQDREFLLHALCRQKKIERLEVWRKRRDGTPIYMVENLIGYFDDRGQLQEITGYVFDDTERKRAEEALRELNATLDNKVKQRTAELEHRARQLQKLALELSEAEDAERRRLAEVLHDDLQQVLAAAKFHLSLLKHRAKNDPSQQATAVQVDHMLKDAIEKSRSLSHELSPAVLHHSDFSETLVWLADQIQIKHGLVVRVHAHGGVGVQSDALRAFLYKAAQELLFNVVKHARVDEADVRVRRRGRCIALSVSDQGRGFDPQELKAAAGFGLFSIQERVELLGGRMKIRSAKGRGSKFRITVPDGPPLEGLRPADDGIVLKSSKAQPCPPASAQRMRILLADDHQIVREGLISLLREQHNMEVVGEAANGREAIDLANRLRPDVIIMDVAMPLINGDEATRQIKAQLPDTRIIALSMYDEPELVERMSRAGAEAFILKTDPSETLVAALRGQRPAP